MTTDSVHSVLGGMSADQFFAEYWQKKPLLIRQALPEVVNLLLPEDMLELAQQEGVTARLLSQHGKKNQRWKIKNSPLRDKHFKKLPEYWTLLVQAVDHFSPEVAALWRHFDFIPQWRRDDIMVSYAPKGGSVGQHFDQYDVFLLQGYGHRRWQLGQYCDESSEFVPDQPLRLLPNIEVSFDEVLAAGDLLYVPPTLAHYGVAQDDCLTYSFGFRMPNLAQITDELSHQIATCTQHHTPIVEKNQRKPHTGSGEVTQSELAFLKQQLIDAINHTDTFNHSCLKLLSDSKFPDSIPDNDPISPQQLKQQLSAGATIQKEPAIQLLYIQQAQGQQFWANGDMLCVNKALQPVLKQLADGQQLGWAHLQPLSANTLTALADLISQSVLFLDELEL